jgi:hypothetical protein
MRYSPLVLVLVPMASLQHGPPISVWSAGPVRDLSLPTTREGAILGPTTTPNRGNVGL